MNTTGSDFDTVLAVYTGTSVSNLSQVAANDDSGGVLTSAVIFDAMSGTNYWIAVDGFGGTTGSIVLNLAVTFAPLITSQPPSQTAFIGGIAQFSVGATGASPFSYQWRLGGTNVAGATNPALVLSRVQLGQAGPYSVVVSNGFGAVISSDAWLSVSPVAAWGDDGNGQADVPPGLANVVAVAGGLYHSLALSGEGTVLGWGTDALGQSDVPKGLSDVVAIGDGFYHSVALRANGRVVAWGLNYLGQTSVPTDLTNAVAIAVGSQHNVALKSDGTVVAWGNPVATQVPAQLSNVVAVAAGESYSLALKADGSVIAWGDNSYGQTNLPSGLTSAIAIAAGRVFSLALRSDGTVIAWGTGYSGETVLPADLTNVVAIAAGGEHSLALKNDGTVVAWGRNLAGAAIVPAGLSNVVAIAGGGYHSLAIVDMPALRPTLFNPARKGAHFTAILATLNRKSYALEYKNSLNEPTWTRLPAITGNGCSRMLTDPDATVPERLYRAVQQ